MASTYGVLLWVKCLEAVIFTFAAMSLSGCAVQERVTGEASPSGWVHAMTDKTRVTGARHDFAVNLHAVKEGMTREEVIKLLGEPDDVQHPRDVAAQHEDLCYGTLEHGGFATLGRVRMDAQGRVASKSGVGRQRSFSLWGGDVEEPFDTHRSDLLAARLGEARLKHVLGALGALGGEDSLELDPKELVSAVNALQPLGEEQALFVIEELIAISGKPWDWDALLLAVRLLYEAPPYDKSKEREDAENDFQTVTRSGYFRPPFNGLGGGYTAERARMPWYPVAVENGVPVVVATSVMLSGATEGPVSHMRLFVREKAQWRRKPMAPPDDLMQVLPQFLALWPEEEREDMKPVVLRALFRMLDTVYRAPHDEFRGLILEAKEADPAYVSAQLKKMKVRWDGVQGCYVRGDGMVLK